MGQPTILGPIPDAYSILTDAAELRKLANRVREDCLAAGTPRVSITASGLIDLARTMESAAIIIDRLVLALEENDQSLVIDI